MEIRTCLVCPYHPFYFCLKMFFSVVNIVPTKTVDKLCTWICQTAEGPGKVPWNEAFVAAQLQLYKGICIDKCHHVVKVFVS